VHSEGMLKHRWTQCSLAALTVIVSLHAHQNLHVETHNLPPGQNLLWVDPGDPALFDFRYGVGGSENRPQPPFLFVEEDMSGTHAKVTVTDARGAVWNIKWGSEATPSAFCTRLVSACGYFVEAEYFLAGGRIENVHGLKRAKSHVANDGSFVDGRFQLRSGNAKFLDDISWTWTTNPFVHTPQMQGLKILMLLVSNWDSKDARDRANGHMDSNLGIFADDSSGERRYIYAYDDWGGTLGKWGNRFTWTRGDCRGFAQQTPDFVKRADDGSLRWGFSGKHRNDLTADITVSDVKWLLQYLGRITDVQIRSGLEASGATVDDLECYAKSLRQRIEQLQAVAGQVPAQTGAFSSSQRAFSTATDRLYR
jgi:hypothetical protein